MTRHDDNLIAVVASTDAAVTRENHGSRLLRIIVISLTVLLILIVIILTIISTLLSTSKGSEWVVNQLSDMLNNDSQSLSIRATQGTLLWGMTLRDVHYQAAGNSVQARELRSRWNPFTLLAGEFSLDQIQITNLQVIWHSVTDEDTNTVTGDPLANILPLPIGVNLQEFMLRDATIDFDGQKQQIQLLRFSASLHDTQLRLNNLRFEATPIQVNGTAQIELIPAYPLQLDLNWRYSDTIVEGIDGANGRLIVGGDLNTLTVNHDLLSPLILDSQGTVTLDLFANSTNTLLKSPRFDLQHQIPAQQLPIPVEPDGTIVRVDSAQISTAGWTDSLTISGVAEVATLTQDGEPLLPAVTLTWDTLLVGQALVVDQLSAATATGSLNAAGNVTWQDGLNLAMTYELREQDASAYKALLPPAFAPGALASTGRIELRQVGEAYQGMAAIESLDGELNGYPLSGGGVFSFAEGNYELANVHLNSADNRLEVTGHWADVIDLSWQLQAETLATLSPLLSGSLSAQGNVAGTADEPRITLNADGTDIVYDTVSIDDLTMEGSYSNGDNILTLNAKNIAFGANPDQRIDSITATASGQPAQHTLELVLNSPLAHAELALAGGLSESEPGLWEGQLRRGVIRSELGSWRRQQSVPLRLSAAQVVVSEHCWTESESELCFSANWRESGDLQASAALRNYPLALFNPTPQGERGSEFETAFIPHLPSGSTLEGVLSAELNANGRLTDNPADLALSFNIDADEGQINVATVQVVDEVAASANVSSPPPEDETQEFHWRAAVLNGTRQNNEWATNASVNFYQPNLVDSGMSVQGSARAQLTMDQTQRLDGRIDLDFDDLSWVEAFTPLVEDPQGQLSGQVSISGTLSDPLVGGNLTLANASLHIPALGLELTDLTTALTSNGSDLMTLRGEVSSGDGVLHFDSEVQNPLEDDRALRLTLDGENFELANLPELHLTITPNLTVTANLTGINASGSLVLPVLDVTITTLPESAVNVSADTVLVAQPSGEPEIHNAATADRGILQDVPMTGQLHLVLGDDVHFTGFGLHTQLAGALDITQRATGAPLTYGELTVVEGNYQIYGRTLTIEHGKLLFFGSYDNPALDIRAVRQAEDVKVGVQMNGTLRNIRSQLFSTPTLPDGDIIAVMLTGRPFAEIGDEDSNALIGAVTSLGINQGQSLTNQIRNKLGLDTLAINSTGDTANSSLTLGKYLTPKIFIRYGVGLFETESTLAVDYSVTDRVKLEAKSGSTQSIDLTYTVEK